MSLRIDSLKWWAHRIQRTLCAAVVCGAIALLLPAPAQANDDDTAPPHAALVQLAQRYAAQPPADSAADAVPQRAAATSPAASSPVADDSPAVPATPAIEQQPLGTAPSHEHQPLQSVEGDRATGGSWMLNTLTALGAVLGLIFVFRNLLQRAGGRLAGAGGRGVIEVVTRVPVGNRTNVLVLRTGNRMLILGESSAGLSTLCEVTDPDEVASLMASVAAAQPRSMSQGFTDLLQRFHREQDDAMVSELGADDAEFAVDRARDRVSGLLSRVRAMGSGRADS